MEKMHDCTPHYNIQGQDTPCPTPAMPVENMPIDRMADVFQVLSDKNRLKMVLMCLNCERTVSEIIELTGISQSLVSHNLRHLRDLRILRSRKDGKYQYYTVSDYHIYHIITDLAHHIEECE